MATEMPPVILRVYFSLLKVAWGQKNLIPRQEHNGIAKYRLPLYVVRDKDVVYFSDGYRARSNFNLYL